MNWRVESCLIPGGEVRIEVENLTKEGGYEPAWYTTLNKEEDRPAWFLARNQNRLIGFLTIFDPSGEEAEVSAYVDPVFRQQGVFKALWDQARSQWAQPSRRWLLVTNRADGAATSVARHWGTYAFTESSLSLPVAARPPFSGLSSGLTLMEGGEEDLEGAAEVFRLANGDDDHHRPFLEKILVDPDRRFYVLKDSQRPVGVGCLHREGGKTMVHGLVVHPDFQGRGWGRALVIALLDLGARGTESFLIEVDSTNERAERLYRSVGFRDSQVTDYYEVAAP